MLSTSPSNVAKPLLGRQLDHKRDDAILQATIECLIEVGYDSLTMDAVATRAHASKSTIYRRWTSKQTLTIDALIHWRNSNAPVACIVSSHQGDCQVSDDLALSPPGNDQYLPIVLSLTTVAGRDARIASVLDAHIIAPRRRAIESEMSRIDSGALASRDSIRDFFPDLILGLEILRRIDGQTIENECLCALMRELVKLMTPTPDSNMV